MNDFETDLRNRLAAAADQAPKFAGLDPDRQPATEHPATEHRISDPSASDLSASRRGPRRGTSWLLVAAAIAAVVAGGSWWSLTRDTADPGVASCPSVLILNGQQYGANGDLVRVPRPGARLGTATFPSCADGDSGATKGGSVETFRIPGVPPETAFFADGKVWVNGSLTTRPASLDELYKPVTCAGSGTGTFTGHLTAMDAQVTADYQPEAPYTATFVVDDVETGTGGDTADLGLGRYSSVTVQIRVTASTEGGTDATFLRAALGQGKLAQMDAQCDGAKFLATRLALHP